MLCAGLGLAWLVSASACATSPDDFVPPGTWGGEHAVLTVNGTGATIEFDCAHGALPVPITLDRGGFDVAGDYFPEHGGPIRVDEPVVRQAARYRGTVVGKSMTMRVTLTDTSQTIGTFMLTLGASGRVFKC